MERKVDNYLDQLQEGPILIGMGILAATLAVLGGIDYAKGRKAESILKKNKPLVDRIVAANIKMVSGKAKQLGISLSRTLNTKYKDIIQLFPAHIKNEINNLPKANYDNEVKNFIDSHLKRTVKYKRKYKPAAYGGFFFHHMGIGIMEGPASEAAEEKHKEWEENDYNNPSYNAWRKKYNQYVEVVLKADRAIFPLFENIVKNIIQQLNKLLKAQIQESVNEAGFTSKPKGWTDDSIKKFSKTFTKKMKGNVKDKGFFDKCVKKMQGKMENPEGFCASLKDEAYGSTYWRGKDKSKKEVSKDVAVHKNVGESIVVANFLQSLYTDNRGQAKEWRGANIPIGDDSNRPNLIRQCMTLEGNNKKINCLRKLRDQAAMNPFYQARLDRFVDAITDIYEPTDKQGTIPGNEFKETAVGEDMD